MSNKICPKDHGERVALFRAQVLGPVLNRTLERGELSAELERLSHRRFRAPDSRATRTYALPTLRRWYRRYRAGGIAALTPASRIAGHALALTSEERELLLEIRRQHRSTPVGVILETLETEGRLNPGKVSQETVRRLFRRHGLTRQNSHETQRGQGDRRRWEAEYVGALWHTDVCHGPTLSSGKRKTSVRIHALMDDKSRYVVALRVLDHEREIGMLDLLVEAVRHYGAPGILYLDNGSTYRGLALETVCARLDINLLHASPHDPQARGKMERFWRSMRDGCLGQIGTVSSLHEIQVRLSAWLSERYHKRAHASLVGRSPGKAWRDRKLRHMDEAALREALTLRERRLVRADCTLAVGGIDWELAPGFLVGHKVTVARTLADATAAPWVEYEGVRYDLEPVNPVANGKLRKRRPKRPGIDAVDFDPATVLLGVYLGRRRQKGGAA